MKEMSWLASPTALVVTIQVSFPCMDNFGLAEFPACCQFLVQGRAWLKALTFASDHKHLLYEGNWVKGVREGTGTYYYPSGEVYSGADHMIPWQSSNCLTACHRAEIDPKASPPAVDLQVNGI